MRGRASTVVSVTLSRSRRNTATSDERTPTRIVDGRSQPATPVLTEVPLLSAGWMPPSEPRNRSFAPDIGLVRSAKSRLPITEMSTPKPSFCCTFDETTVASTTTCDGGVSISASSFSIDLMLSGKSLTTSMPWKAQLSVPPSVEAGWKPFSTSPTNEALPCSESSGLMNSFASFAFRYWSEKLRLTRLRRAVAIASHSAAV